MKFFKAFLLFIIGIFSFLFFVFYPVRADELQDIQKKIDEYQAKINELQGQQKTLFSTISYLDNKIYLTATQISKTEQEIIILEDEITKLTVKIGRLDSSLNELSKILNSRISATYKNSMVKPAYLFFSSNTFSSYLSRLQYLKIAQANDRAMMVDMEEAKQDYDNQKDLKEVKQEDLEELKLILVSQKATLDKNKQEKQVLLEATKNDEKKYQQMLRAAQAEMEAIQSIIAGGGDENQVGEVSTHARIATVISGVSACSSGTHLHFEVVKGSAHQNPGSFLKSIGVIWDNSPDGQFSFSGSWDWPLDEPVRLTQGYGSTYWSGLGWYGGGPHTGIDLVSNTSSGVKAVADGTLFRGSIACGGGTLRYVKVDHKDSDVDTYYLHVNYY